jgi:DNA-binding MarR family transcriptional regulator
MTDTSITPTESETQLAEQLRVALGRLNRSLRLTHIDTDLPPSQREVLMAVARVPSIRLSELSQEEGINPTMLSRIVAKLEASGLVTRTPDGEDARIMHVTVTASGKSLRDTIRSERTDALHYALRHLTNDEQRTLAEATPVLEKIVATLRERQ